MSRHSRPKQFQPILGNESLFESKLDEIRPLVKSWNDIYISTAADYVPIVRRLAPQIPSRNIIAEPTRRNTGPGIALETAVIAKRYAPWDPVILSLTVDDVMLKRALFCRVLAASAKYLQHTDPEAIVTVGCPVDGMDGGLSYLVLGQDMHRGSAYTLSEVSEWIEKPDHVRLRKLLKRSNIAAHTGLYCWRASTVLRIIQEQHPEVMKKLVRITETLDTPRFTSTLSRIFPSFPSTSVEDFVTKHADSVVAAVADLHWRDTGKWFLVHELRRSHPGANVTEGKVIAIDTRDSIIYAPAGKVVATVGLENIVVIDTGDALLVCSKNQSGDVKHIVAELERQKLHRHL